MRYSNHDMSPGFVERLNAVFDVEGVSRRLGVLERASGQYESDLGAYGGYQSLIDAFQSFVLETIDVATSVGLCLPTIAQPYTWFIPRVVQDFKSIRAAEIVTHRGYPYQGYTVLRNTFDNIAMTSAAMQNVVHWLHVDGIEPALRGRPIDAERARLFRIRTERRAIQAMTGAQSGLSAETVATLQHWDSLFNLEVHGGRLSLIGAMDWMQAKGPLYVSPNFVQAEFAMYMNRVIEIAWMLHRLLPLIQANEIELPGEWQSRWSLLDEIFEAMVLTLTVKLGKKIGAAMVEFVNLKFPWDGTSRFPELPLDA